MSFARNVTQTLIPFGETYVFDEYGTLLDENPEDFKERPHLWSYFCSDDSPAFIEEVDDFVGGWSGFFFLVRAYPADGFVEYSYVPAERWR